MNSGIKITGLKESSMFNQKELSDFGPSLIYALNTK